MPQVSGSSNRLNDSEIMVDVVQKASDTSCHKCGISSAENRLIGKKKTRKNRNKDQIMYCSKCLVKERHHDICIDLRNQISTDEEHTTSLQENKRKEPRFRLWVFEKISEAKDNKWELMDLINAGAEAIGISPMTARRHLDKMCSSVGVLTKKYDGKTVHVAFKDVISDGTV